MYTSLAPILNYVCIIVPLVHLLLCQSLTAFAKLAQLECKYLTDLLVCVEDVSLERETLL